MRRGRHAAGKSPMPVRYCRRGKTLDLLIPALLSASGAALVTLTKVDDLLLSFPMRSRDGRPCLVLDPFGLAAGLPELVWDPIAGCIDPMVAERRAKAFTASTIKAALGGGCRDVTARFYAAEAAKVIQAYFHAAALTGRSLDEVLRWVANPISAGEPAEILLQHPHAAPYWLGLLHGALHGDDRTRRQHDHDSAAGDEPVLPRTDPPPLCAQSWSTGHRFSWCDSPRRHHLSVGSRRPVCVGIAVDDRGRRAGLGH